MSKKGSSRQDKSTNSNETQSADKNENRIGERVMYQRGGRKTDRSERRRACAYWLASIDGVGSRRLVALREIWMQRQRPGQDFTFPESICEMGGEELFSLCMEAWGESLQTDRAIRAVSAARLRKPETAYRRLVQKGISFYSMEDERFPEKLRQIPDPPYAIYVRGRLPDPGRPALAVIGARTASAYGREQARRYSAAMAENGIQIISGMACGIDGIAGTAALDAHGGSFAVLGSGVDVCYPAENQALYDRLLQEGGVLSEYSPGTRPRARLFPARNRIISALADAVFVVEARLRSGTLITVDMALEQGKEVFALPGRVSDALSSGCNNLIRQGAAIVTDPEDLLEFFYGVRDDERMVKWEKRSRALNSSRKMWREEAENSWRTAGSSRGTKENSQKEEQGEQQQETELNELKRREIESEQPKRNGKETEQYQQRNRRPEQQRSQRQERSQSRERGHSAEQPLFTRNMEELLTPVEAAVYRALEREELRGLDEVTELAGRELCGDGHAEDCKVRREIPDSETAGGPPICTLSTAETMQAMTMLILKGLVRESAPGRYQKIR